MRVILSKKAEADFAYWTKSGNKAILKKIGYLIEDIQMHPYEGIGNRSSLSTSFQAYGQEGLIANTD